MVVSSFGLFWLVMNGGGWLWVVAGEGRWWWVVLGGGIVSSSPIFQIKKFSSISD